MVHTDVAIVGSGFAGLWAAITARDAGADRVTIVDKADIARSSQSRLSAGATIYLLEGDDLDLWVHDVTEAQRWLCHQDMVEDMLATSTGRLHQLEAWGLRYARIGTEHLRLPSRGFRHLQMLVLPTYRRRTGGRAVTTVLREQVVRRRCHLLPRRFVTDLLTCEGAVRGLVTLDRTDASPLVIEADAVVLATGDCSFRGHYACVDAATGDGAALAFEAGARLTNMEFLCVNTGPPGYGFEGTGVATRFGGVFRNSDGEAFLANYHPDGDTAEVDHVVAAMAAEAEAGRGPFTLDLRAAADEHSVLRTALARMGGFMPLNLERLAASGVDVFADPQPWEPAVQTLRGGARTGIDGDTDLTGLFAAGTAQAFDPGLFNGWSSQRAMWSGQRAGRAAAAHAAGSRAARSHGVASLTSSASGRRQVAARVTRSREPLDNPVVNGTDPREAQAELHRLLFSPHVCVDKRSPELESALDDLRVLRGELDKLRADDPHQLVQALEVRNQVQVAELYLVASATRTESRGDHRRADHPGTDQERWLRWIALSRPAREAAATVGPLVELEPVPLDRYRYPRPDNGSAGHPSVVTGASDRPEASPEAAL